MTPSTAEWDLGPTRAVLEDQDRRSLSYEGFPRKALGRHLLLHALRQSLQVLVEHHQARGLATVGGETRARRCR